MSTALTKASTIKELVCTFQAAERVIRESFAAIVAAEVELNAAFTLGGSRNMRVDASHHGYHDDFKDPDNAIGRLRRQAWTHIVERLEMRRAMSIERYAELGRQLNDGELPPITEANVAAFAERYAGDLPELLREAVREVFEFLRPRRSKLKTNSELEIGERVILPNLVEEHFLGSGMRVRYHRQQNLIALENVFNSLDGRGQVGRSHYSELQTAIETGAGWGETSLFEFKACKNGNLHLRFKRLDLLGRLNAIAGGARLRPGTGVAA